jgi:hypothetical protein
MVIRILTVPDALLLHEFDAVFRAVLGWEVLVQTDGDRGTMTECSGSYR